MYKIFYGPGGTGKTTELRKIYKNIVDNHGTEKCLVFVKNALCVRKWLSEIEMEIMGPRKFFTYFGFVQREVRRFWPLIEESLSENDKVIEPVFMNVETAHYLMCKYVEDHRSNNDIFDYVNASSSRIAVQLIDNLNQGAMNCLSLSQLKDKLIAWAGNDKEKKLVLGEAMKVMKKFRNFCFNKRILDYSLLIHLYNDYLLSEKEYAGDFKKRYSYLIVDDLEKTVPAAQNLFLSIFDEIQGGYFSFNPEGGVNRFFGGNPERAKDKFFPHCELIKLTKSHTSSKDARQISSALYQTIFRGKKLPQNDFIRDVINEEYRGDMLKKVIERVNELIDGGTSPERIALIAPGIDKVMEFTLKHYFKNRDIPFFNLNHSRRLVDIPFARALITLALLAGPDRGDNITFSSLQQTLGLILKLDPVRSAFLTEEIFKRGLNFPDPAEGDFCSHLSEKSVEEYTFFYRWLKEKEKKEIELESFFQSVFGELLAPLFPDRKDILACKQLIDSIEHFKEVVGEFKDFGEKEMGYYFIDMINEGTLAAEVLYRQESETEKVILATPYKFLFTPGMGSVDYLFLIDISSQNWLQGVCKELTNPYIISEQVENEWDDDTDNSFRKEQLLNFLQCLLKRCKKALYPVDSYLDSRGWEQEGPLYDWLLEEEMGERND